MFLMIIPAENILLPFAEIDEALYLEQPPRMRKIFGKDGFGALVGDFRSDDFGELKAYVRQQTGPAVLIKTKSRTYIITPEDAQEFTDKILLGKKIK